MFSLNEKETKKYEKFISKHNSCKKPTGTVGISPIAISFRNTSIGTIIAVSCDTCGKTKDITDYDSF